jgi:outer membrane protein
MLKKIASLFFCLFLFTELNAQSPLPEVWSLTDCVDYALAQNLSVEQARLRSKIADNNLQTARLDYLPDLRLGNNLFWNFGLNIDPVTNQISRQSRQTANFQLSSNWILYNGGAKYNTIAQRNHDLKAAQYDYEAARNDISLLVASSYLQILLNKEIAAVAREQVRISGLQVERTRKLVKAGTLPEGELLQLEAQLARDEQNLISTENAVIIARLQLANILQLEDPDSFEIGTPDLGLPNAEVLDRPAANVFEVAVDKQPAIRAAEMRVLSGEEGIDLAYSGYLPTLSLIGQVGTNYSDQIPNVTGSNPTVIPFGYVGSTGEPVFVQQEVPVTDGIKPFNNQVSDNLNQLVGLSLQVPIFSRRAVANNLQNAKINANINKLNLEQAKNDLRQTIYQAHADAKAAKLQFEAASKSVTASQKAFDYARQRFEVGALNQVDFETAKNNLAAAQSQYAQAKFDFIFRIKVLEFYLTNNVNL